MPLYGKKRNYRRGAKKATRKPKGNGVKVMQPVINPAIVAYVKQMLGRKNEVKFFTQAIATKTVLNGTGFNTTGNFGFNSGVIIPQISQGIGQTQRNGNQINPKGKLLVKGHVLALPTSSTTNPFPNMPFYVRIVIWRHKLNYTQTTNSDILDNGFTAGGNPFDGTLDDLNVPFNKDKYDIGGVRIFSIQPNSTVGTYSAENLSKFPISRYFKMYVKLPSKLVYNDAPLEPSNCRWYLSAGVVNHDGTLSVNTNYRANITADATMRWTDA